jgi:hypothetical protein
MECSRLIPITTASTWPFALVVFSEYREGGSCFPFLFFNNLLKAFIEVAVFH